MSQRPELTGVELWGPRQDRSGPKGRRLAQVEINELGGPHSALVKTPRSQFCAQIPSVPYGSPSKGCAHTASGNLRTGHQGDRQILQ